MTYPVQEHADEQEAPSKVRSTGGQDSGRGCSRWRWTLRSACGCGGPIPSGKLGWPHTSFSAET